MNKTVSIKNEGDSQKDNQDVVALLKKMQYQLDSMERKIDSLARQSKPKTFAGRSFSTPSREYDKSKRQYGGKFKGSKEGVSSEGKFYHGLPFDKKKDSGKSSFKKSKHR